MQKNCANCKNSYIKDGCYLICEIDGIQNDVVENCENFEVDPDLEKEVAEDLCSTCDVAERMRKMICLVSNGMMSYANYTYEAMSEVYQEQIDKLAEEKCKDYKQALKEIKEIAESKVKPNLVKRMNGTAKYGIDRIIELAEMEE